MKKLTWDISTRTQIISLGPALLLTLLLISFFTFVRIQDLRQELNHTGQLIANQLAPASEYGVISGNDEVLESLMRATLTIPHVRFLEVQDSENHILVYVEQADEHENRPQQVEVVFDRRHHAGLRTTRQHTRHDPAKAPGSLPPTEDRLPHHRGQFHPRGQGRRQRSETTHRLCRRVDHGALRDNGLRHRL